jgi:molybdopterin-guanine dinucleotide biosynthesis protein A
MKAVILAGGLGTRISEETSTRPKPMIEIGGKPILWHILKTYSHHGINDFVICHVERLDDFVSANNLHVNFIKCDIEGAELFAFKGAMETLQRDKPIVFTEMLRKWAAKFNYHPNEIIALFSSLGYRCFYAEGSTLKEITEMTDEAVETNFFFLHSIMHAKNIGELI